MYREVVKTLLEALARVRVSAISVVPKLSWVVGSGWGRWGRDRAVQHAHMHTRMQSSLRFLLI